MDAVHLEIAGEAALGERSQVSEERLEEESIDLEVESHRGVPTLEALQELLILKGYPSKGPGLFSDREAAISSPAAGLIEGIRATEFLAFQRPGCLGVMLGPCQVSERSVQSRVF